MIDLAALRTGKLRRKTQRRGRSPIGNARAAVRQVGGLRHVVRSAWRSGQAMRAPGVSRQSDALHGLTPAEHHALPVALAVQRFQQAEWESKGSWVLDTGLSRNLDLSQSNYHTADEVHEAALMLPKKHQTGDVRIFFRQTGDAACVYPFDSSNNEDVPARLARLEADYMELENFDKRNTSKLTNPKQMDARMKAHTEQEVEA